MRQINHAPHDMRLMACAMQPKIAIACQRSAADTAFLRELEVSLATFKRDIEFHWPGLWCIFWLQVLLGQAALF